MTSQSGKTALATPPSAARGDPNAAPGPAVTESRRIVFSNEALRAALIELERRQMLKPPPGIIVACQLAEDHSHPVRLTFHDVLADERRDVEVPETGLAAALIQYCIMEGIPIPRAAEKHLELADGKIALNFALPPECG